MDGKALKRNFVTIVALAEPADLAMLAVQHFDRRGRIPAGARKAINIVGVTFFNASWILVPLLSQPRLKKPWAAWGKALGAPLMLCGALLGGISTWNRKIIGIETPNTLVTGGVYRYLRHPTYAAVIAGSLGWAFFRGTPYAAVALPPLALESIAAGLYEEKAQLVPLFGRDFEEYRKATPFFPATLSALFIVVYVLALAGMNGRFLEE
jgi:protein-S-isoprenylcysteine O-methyltransferase Ste14